jgi:hypothetical protein
MRERRRTFGVQKAASLQARGRSPSGGEGRIEACPEAFARETVNGKRKGDVISKAERLAEIRDQNQI